MMKYYLLGSVTYTELALWLHSNYIHRERKINSKTQKPQQNE